MELGRPITGLIFEFPGGYNQRETMMSRSGKGGEFELLILM